MALKLIASYSKRLGLPEYSSHQFSVTIETELTGAEDIAGESERLYQTLQNSVDEQIQKTGFVPVKGYGTNGHKPNGNGSHATNGNGNGTNGTNGQSFLGKWECSQKQQDLILKLIEDNQLSKPGIEKHANEMFGKGVKHLDTNEASALIKWMFGLTTTATGRGRRPATSYRE
ncbi:hypothetical protein BH09VER1_BH09VER1_23920 [soil metagenome]